MIFGFYVDRNKLRLDTDGDGILDNGDNIGTAGDNPCTGGQTQNCDDNCPNTQNTDQADFDLDGIGDACEERPVAFIDGPSQLYVHQVGDYNCNSSSSPNGSITDCDWVFWGPNNYSWQTWGWNNSFSWDIPGAYKIELTVTDDIGLTGDIEKTVNVIQGGPEIVEVNIIQLTPYAGEQFVLEKGEAYVIDVRVIENNPAFNPINIIVEVKEVDPDDPQNVLRIESESKFIPTETIVGFVVPNTYFPYEHSWDWMGILSDEQSGIRTFSKLVTGTDATWASIKPLYLTTAQKIASRTLSVTNAVTVLIEWLLTEDELITQCNYQYEITAYDDHGIISATSPQVSIIVPQYKIDNLRIYFLASFTQTALTLIGGPVGWVGEGLLLALAEAAYQNAIDPDPNFTELAALESISLSSIDNLTDPLSKSLGENLLKALAAKKAMGTSLGRYEGAKVAGDKTWMIAQLEAAQGFSEILMVALSDVETSIASFIEELKSEGFFLTQDDIQNVKTQLLNEGLPQLESNILTELGFSIEDINLAGQATAGLMDYMSTDWEELLTDGVNGIMEIQGKIADWTDERILSLKDPDDLDNDGVPDDQDNCPDVPNQNQADADGDGVGDVCDNCPDVPNPEQIDSDSDGTGDQCDNCSDDPNKTNPGICGCGVTDADSDGDGVADCNDNCIDVGNQSQEDSDEDGVGNVCDNCPDTLNPDQLDSNGNGIGDACEIIDSDGDGVPDDQDICPGFDDNLDADGDDVPDGCDPCPLDSLDDADSDGICGDVDNCPLTSNPDQADSDGNGTGDACEEQTIDGDLNRDGYVDFTDLSIVTNCFAQDPATCDPRADVNGDGMVNILDVSLVISNF